MITAKAKALLIKILISIGAIIIILLLGWRLHIVQNNNTELRTELIKVKADNDRLVNERETAEQATQKYITQANQIEHSKNEYIKQLKASVKDSCYDTRLPDDIKRLLNDQD